MNQLARVLILIIILCITQTSIGKNEDIIIINDAFTLSNISDKVRVYSDTSNSMTIKEVDSMEFMKQEIAVPNLAVTDNTHWVKFKLKNNTDESRLILQIEYPILDKVILHSPMDNGEYRSVLMGDHLLYAQRKYEHPNYLFDLNLLPGEIKEYYLEIRSGEQILLPMNVGNAKTVFENNKLKDIVFGIYFGIILVMFFYNLFIYFSVKDASYLYYVFYIFIVGMVQITFPGYSFEFIWPESLWWSKHGLLLFGSMSGISIMLFTYHFLQIKVIAPRLRYLIYFIIGLYIIPFVVTFFDQYNLAYSLIDMSGAILSFATLFIAIRLVVKGYRPAKFFLVAWVIFLIGVFVFIFRSLGVLPYNDFTNYTMPLGSAIEVVLLSFALADKINVLKREREASRKRELEALQENEKIIREQNIVLEQKVKERTIELEQTNEELQVTLEHLKDTQTQLVESEKMASLGQLTAGIAHEINNPINFVISNINPLKRDVDDLLELIDKYGGVKATDDNIDDVLKSVMNFKDEIDLPYLKQEIEQILKGIEDGAARTSEIVIGLRTFSRLDEGDLKTASMVHCLDSTLTVLKSKIKEVDLELEKDYQSNLEIECFPGKLNQLFLNMISNAIDTIESKGGKGKIKLGVQEDGEEARIEISDTGEGMDEETKKRLFEPFYTTKDVGKGTGLGMSIVYSIIEEHKGRIIVESELGVGTKFVVYLPIKHQKTN